MEIMSAIGDSKYECGGILGAYPNRPISEFYYDKSGENTALSYTPDFEAINNILKNEWNPRGIYMVGIVHSHVNQGGFPSCGDLFYGERILRSLSTEKFFLPVITISPLKFNGYSIQLDASGKLKTTKEKITIV